MDANEQRPRPELGVPQAPDAGVYAAREAACRAAHPSSRRLPASQDLRNDEAAEHYERTAVRWLATQTERLVGPTSNDERAATLQTIRDLALLVGLRLRRGSEPLGADYTALVTTLASLAARADSRDLLRQDPQALLPLVTVQWALTAHGRPDPCLAQALELVVGEHSVLGLARTPHDQIALHLLLRQAGIDLPCPQLSALLATSVLADDKVALELTGSDARALATIVVIGSDFGASEISWPAGRTPAGVAGVLQEWLLLGMADEDPGLVGLLLTSLTCLGAASDDKLAEAARRWLHGWQESDGRSDGLPYEVGATTSDALTWAAAMRATVMTALEGLVRRSLAPQPSRPHPAVVSATDSSALVDSIMAAADWLDAVLPGTHVAGRLCLSEAWLALGDDAEARRQLVRLADDPHLAFTVLKQAPDLAVHLAALVVALDVTSPPLADLCDDVAALLSHPEAAQQLFGGPPRPAPTPTERTNAAVRPEDLALAARTKQRCTELLHDGPPHDPRAGIDDLLLLTRSAHRAVATGDVGWLAMAVRGLQRLELTPPRILRDATAVLRSRQRADGALGARPAGDFRGSDDRQVRWTLATLTALVEALPPHDLPRAA